ncbi:anti-sigma factor domain-containing protein [Streptomyces sp. NPDC050523]|uniref:anti-sigma factor n=1 Tax=Streptomyces sp. NPDC050523 TaxID=3365622 RepID=UPI0037B6BC6D
MNAVDVHTLTGAYALHAVSGGEREAVERHLERCEPCAEEVAGFTAAAARLGLAASLAPRPELKARVLRRIATERQQTDRQQTDRQQTDRQRAVAATPLPRRARASARARASVRLRPSRWLPAACVAAAAVFGAGTAWQHQRAEDADGRARRIEQTARDVSAVLTAADARTRTARLAGGARGTVVVSHRLDRAVFAASGMAEPPPGKVYQLWLADGGRMRDAGLMDPHLSTQTLVLRGALDGASGMGVTVEPAGGSAKPTSAPVALLPFPA